MGINVIKDRGDVEIEVLEKPRIQAGLNTSETNYYSLSQKKSGKISVSVKHFARSIPALAEIHTTMQQKNGIITIVNYWDEHFNSLFDCPRSTVKITIPHQVRWYFLALWVFACRISRVLATNDGSDRGYMGDSAGILPCAGHEGRV